MQTVTSPKGKIAHHSTHIGNKTITCIDSYILWFSFSLLMQDWWNLAVSLQLDGCWQGSSCGVLQGHSHCLTVALGSWQCCCLCTDRKSGVTFKAWDHSIASGNSLRVSCYLQRVLELFIKVFFPHLLKSPVHRLVKFPSQEWRQAGPSQAGFPPHVGWIWLLEFQGTVYSHH